MDNGNYERRPPPAYEQIRVLENMNRELEATLESFAAVDRERQAENAKLEAEVERLKHKCNESIGKYRELKEALQEIAERDPVDHTDISPEIAQAALEGKQDG